MSNQLTNYQCPNCTAGLRYDSSLGRLVCDSCSNVFDVSLVEQLSREKASEATSIGTFSEWDLSLYNNYTPEEAARLRSYICPSCAAEIICDDTTAVTSCPYCNNPTVARGQFKEQLKPDYVIPFMVDKTYAITGLEKYYKKKRLLPKDFSSSNHIEEIKGIYVPFWLFDGSAQASMRYRGTKSHSYTSGDYEITETDHYRVVRAGTVAFQKIPVDGSQKIPNAHMDSIEPFDYNYLMPFSIGYMLGFLADKYDEDVATCLPRANARITASTEEAMRSTMREYDTLTQEYSSINLTKGDVKYALLPVWLLSTRWNDKTFMFAMNGQTGKLIGDLPVDKGRYWGWILRIAAPIAAVLAVLLFLI